MQLKPKLQPQDKGKEDMVHSNNKSQSKNSSLEPKILVEGMPMKNLDLTTPNNAKNNFVQQLIRQSPQARLA